MMTIPKTEPGLGDPGFAGEGAQCVATGLPRGASEALADPIVQALMVADRVDPKGLAVLLRRMASGLAKGFALAVLLLTSFLAAPRPAAAATAPVAFINTLGSQAITVIRADEPITMKAAYFEQMIRQDFDLAGLCRFVLGPYWRVASMPERQQFCDLFVDNMIHFYGQQLAQAGDGNFIVTGSRTDADGIIVTSRIVRQQGAPIALDWRLGVDDGFYKIEDVAIDGVSMALAQRSEIASTIAREGGQIGVLLATMRQ